MKNLIPFTYNNIIVNSPDSLADAIDTVKDEEEAVTLITKLCNALTHGPVSDKHLKHACTCCSRLASGSNIHISNAIIRIW